MMSSETYHKPNSVSEALTLAAENKDGFRFIAGGTDFLVNKFQGSESAICIIDLSGIDELKTVKIEKDFLKIGSLVRLDALKNFTEIKHEFPVIIEAANSVASPVIRKSATLGGNLLCENRCSFYNQSEWWREAVGHCLKCDGEICIATGGDKSCFSKFVSDTAVALISLEASIEYISGEGYQTCRLEEIYTGSGVKPRNFRSDAIITAILLPVNQGAISVFKKLRHRESMDFTSLTTCVSISKDDKVKICIGGVDPGPVVISENSSENIEALIERAVKKPRAIDNDIFSRKYRKEMIKVFLENSFREAASGKR